MSFIGLITRRVLKCAANSIIDATVSDKKSAAALKVTVGVGITAVGIGVSVLTADPVGLFDAFRDHASEGVATAGEIADHAASLHEVGTHIADFVSNGSTAHESFLHVNDLVGEHAHLASDYGLRFGQDHVHNFFRVMVEASSHAESSGHFAVLHKVLENTNAPQHLLDALSKVIENDLSKLDEVIAGAHQHIANSPAAQSMLPRFSGYQEA